MLTTITLITAALWPAAADNELAVLNSEGGVKPSELVYRHWQHQVHQAMDRRRKSIEKLETAEELRAYQKRMKAFFGRQLGGFPRRSPLNARVVGKLDGDGHRIEKIIFESQPGHHITATLYLPKSKPPWPGVVVASGHSRTGRMAGYNQRFGIIMARHGMAALCYDPIGQGERSQILGKDGKPRFRSTTTEHFLIGVGSILVGRNTARYRIWDGMRCIDYLSSRDDIDSKRIGFTGCSGGGTLTSYVMALDDRVTCAAPACYLTTFRKLVDTIGPQDAEQNIFGQLGYGMDHPDYVLMRAPRPTLISATTKDFFDIRGTWDNFRQCKRIYTKLEHPERIALVEGPGGHGVPMSNLNAIARWMQRWLLEKDRYFQETEIPTRPTKDLLCTPKGQVLQLAGEKSVFQLNKERAESLARLREASRKKSTDAELRQAVRQRAGIRLLKELPKPKVTSHGLVARDGYRIQKLLIARKDGVPLPALRFLPKKPNGTTCLYLHGQGKQEDAQPGGAIEKLVRRGETVLAVDLSGMGETRRSKRAGQLGDWKNFYMAYLLGQSYVGLRAENVLIAARYARAKTGTGKEAAGLHLVAIGEAAIPALHAAAVEPALFDRVALRRMIPSWSRIVADTAPVNQLVNTVHDALELYDLPDLIHLAGGESVTVEHSVDAQGKPLKR